MVKDPYVQLRADYMALPVSLRLRHVVNARRRAANKVADLEYELAHLSTARIAAKQIGRARKELELFTQDILDFALEMESDGHEIPGDLSQPVGAVRAIAGQGLEYAEDAKHPVCDGEDGHESPRQDSRA